MDVPTSLQSNKELTGSSGHAGVKGDGMLNDKEERWVKMQVMAANGDRNRAAPAGVVCTSHNISVELADGQGRYMCPECGGVWRISIMKAC